MKIFRIPSFFSSRGKKEATPHPLSIENNPQVARLLLFVAKYMLVIKYRKDQRCLYDLLDFNIDQTLDAMDKRLWITELANWVGDLIECEPEPLKDVKGLTHSWKHTPTIESSLMTLSGILRNIEDITGDNIPLYFDPIGTRDNTELSIRYQLTLENILFVLTGRWDIFIHVDIERAYPREIDYALFRAGIYGGYEGCCQLKDFEFDASLDMFKYKPTTNWKHGGPLFDQFNLDIFEHDDGFIEASPMHEQGIPRGGRTRLIAACRSVHANATNRKIPKIPLSVVIQRDLHVLKEPIKSWDYYNRPLGKLTLPENNTFQEL
tara:strand:+ start:4364 stop:5326 length:963 start_codon:yes stop_codon:yes gene_type:complete